MHWYSEMFTNSAVWTALGNSLFVAGVSVGLNILCGVPAAIALPNVGRYSRTLFTVLLSLGLSSPTIVTRSTTSISTAALVSWNLTAVASPSP